MTLRGATPSDRDGTAPSRSGIRDSVKRFETRRWLNAYPAATLQQVGKWHAGSRSRPSMV